MQHDFFCLFLSLLFTNAAKKLHHKNLTHSLAADQYENIGLMLATNLIVFDFNIFIQKLLNSWSTFSLSIKFNYILIDFYLNKKSIQNLVYFLLFIVKSYRNLLIIINLIYYAIIFTWMDYRNHYYSLWIYLIKKIIIIRKVNFNSITSLHNVTN